MQSPAFHIGPHRISTPVILAPMAGVTDKPFRQLCKRLGAGLAVSEMTISDSRFWNTGKSRHRMDHAGEPAPISVQIAGTEPAQLAEAARYNVDHGAQIIDINMGCPAKKVCNAWAGSALMRDEALVARILEAVVQAVDVPVTLKIRTGWNAENRNGPRIARIAEDLPKGRAAHAPEYHVYPPELDGAYETRRRGVGEDMYGALAIPREDKPARLAWFARNFQAFGAPVLMLVHTPKYMGPPQWSDIGMWLQTIMLLLREEGLDSCPQEAWAVYSKQIREVVAIPDDHTFFCGLAIGWGDREAPVNRFPVARAPLDEAVRWEGWE